ncbi:MAG: prepilin-type N-terminal cleavage/methylation domain-containing protein [Longimicrobiales bacterium]|nr:prepilin-type N-terminal cleavage/methylation domain-containing protein [Longimicrobiales bacterium]
MNPRNGAGFSLVEVVVALLLLAVATAASSALLLQAAQAAREADHRERMLWAATGVADSLAGPMGGPGTGARRFQDGSRLEWEATAVGGQVRVLLAGEDSAWVVLPLARSAGAQGAAGAGGGGGP